MVRPKLDAVFRRALMSAKHRWITPSFSLCHPVNAALDAFGFPCYPGALLAHALLTVCHHARGISAVLLPSQAGRPQPGWLQGVLPSQLRDLAFGLAEFCHVLVGPFLQPVWITLNGSLPSGMLTVSPNLVPSANLVRPQSIACSGSLIKILNRTNLVVHPSRLWCPNMIMWGSVLLRSKWHPLLSTYLQALCVVARVYGVFFSQTLQSDHLQKFLHWSGKVTQRSNQSY